MHVMSDIDDVLFPLAAKLHSKAHELGLHDNTQAALRVWHGYEQYGCTKEAWNEVFDALHAEDWYLTAQPVPGTVEALRRIAWEGHQISLVTARGFMGRAEEIRRWTQEWVEEFAIPGTVTFARDKVAAQAELGKFDFAIDDGYHNFLALLKDGVNVFLQDQPHNDEELVPVGRRVYSVDEFADIVLDTVPAEAVGSQA